MRTAFMLVLCWAGVAGAAEPQVRVARTVRSDPTPGVPVVVPSGRFYPVDLSAGKPAIYEADDTLVRIVTLKPGERLINQVKYDEPAGEKPADYSFPDAKDGVACIFALSKEGTATIKAYVNGEGAGPPVKSGTIMIQCLLGPMPPPVPPAPPGPAPGPGPAPAPVPVSSFHVIFVKGTNTILTPGQNSIPGAKAIRDYLAKATTAEGGIQGWREYTPTTIATNDTASIRGVWEAALPKMKPTDPPCVVVELNGDVKIIPYEKDAASMLDKLKTYGGK